MKAPGYNFRKARLTMRIIDIHIHVFPDELADRAIPALAAQAGIPAHLDGRVSSIKSSMDEAGICISVVQPVATKPSQVRTINQWAKEITHDNIISFGALHPEYEEWRQEIHRLKDMGIPGIKLHPDYQKFFVDEERMFPIYEAIFQEDLILLLHSGVDIGLPAPYHCCPKRLQRVAETFPGAKIIAAHMGGYDCWDYVEEYLVGTDILFDTSFSSHRMGIERMVNIIRGHGPEKILFGTDSPWTHQKSEVKTIESLPLPLKDKKLILGENAARLLNL